MTDTKVAFIGVGAMGGPMAQRVHEAGFGLVACDISEASLEPFARQGIRVTNRAADCAGCDVAILMVATFEQAHGVLFGPAGLLSAPSEKRPSIVILMGTVSPKAVRDIARDLAPFGIGVIDAPVSGGIVKAREGTLAIIMGGEAEHCERVEPLLRSMGSRLFHCGPVGAGQVTKIVNNAIGIANIMISAEAYRIALDNGLGLDDFVPVIEAGSGRNFFTASTRDAPEAYAAWAPTLPAFHSLQSILRKDIDLALSIGEGSGDLPMIAALRKALEDVGTGTFETWRRVVEAADDVPRDGADA